MTTANRNRTPGQNLRPLAAATLAVLVGMALIGCGGIAEVTSEPAASPHDQADHASHAETLHATNGAADHASHAETLHVTNGATGHPNHVDALPATPSDQVPGTSLYHLSSAWTDRDGEAFSLPELRGGPAVFVMFYGDCTTACPLLVKSAQDISDALSDEQRATTQFVMVTFDTGRDTPEKLAAYAGEKGLDRDTWHWLVGSPLQTRQLATLLGVQYRDAGNGMFAHSNVVTVVDPNGVPLARLEGLGIDLGPAVVAIAEAATSD